MEVRVCHKLSSSEFKSLIGTQSMENLLSNKLEIYSNKTEDDLVFDLVDHFSLYAQGMFYFENRSIDNIFRLYFSSTGDRNRFLELCNSTNNAGELGSIESVVVNTTDV